LRLKMVRQGGATFTTGIQYSRNSHVW